MAAVVAVLAIIGGSNAWADPATTPVATPSVPSVEQLEQAVRDNPSAAARQNLAEGYLRDCHLEKSLKLWQEILKADPVNARARQVVDRLTTQALDLDGHLAVLETLIDKGVTQGTSGLLDAAGERSATVAQKATILYLRGRLAGVTNQEARARACFESAMKLYPSTPGAGRSAIALAPVESRAGRIDQARHLLTTVIEDKKLTDEAVRQQAMFKLALMDTAGLTSQEKTAVLRDLLAKVTDNGVKRDLLAELTGVLTSAQGRWTPEAVDAAAAAFATGPTYEQAGLMLAQLMSVARNSQDGPTLDRLLTALDKLTLAEDALKREASFVRVQALLTRAVVEDKPAEMGRFLTAATAALDKLAGGAAGNAAVYPDRPRVQQLRGRALLIEAQKLAVLKGPEFALPILLRAKDHYLESLASEPVECFQRLASIGELLENVREWETAVALYREIATRFPQLPAGRDALLRVAQLYDQKLDAPMNALETYAEYAARYPAELPYRQLAVGERLRRLGYANVLDFQKRNNLKTDGLFGKAGASRLAELEASFDLISVRVGGDDEPAAEVDETPTGPAGGKSDGSDGDGDATNEGAMPGTSSSSTSSSVAPTTPPAPVSPRAQPRDKSKTRLARPVLADSNASGLLRGQYVHPAMFAIAQRLDQSGLHRDAIIAYRLVLNLFPSKVQASGCLVAIARLFRDNLMFDEALGAYRQVMDDYPKGDMTREAYIEAAACLENLGRWKQARELYELYVKNFPKNARVPLCKGRVALLDEILQYEDFIATNPTSPKVAEAQYQIASILYKQFGSFIKSAIEFRKVVDGHPQHVRAADGLFTAGVAYLKAENFPAARKEFADLVSRYADSRLADDAQYWIGHTYEYSARSLGKLDGKRIVVKRRGLKGRAELLADLSLRRFYFPAAVAGPGLGMSADVWGGDVLGVLTSGSKRDRVNADLFDAIRAYRKVVDNYKMGDMAGNALLRVGIIYTDYLNDPDKGADAYKELLANYPGSKEAVNALFEVGAYQVKNKKFDDAVKSYQQFIFNYQSDPKVEDAMVAIARCHAEKKDWAKALDAYQGYLTKFPNGKHAAAARGQVEWIRMYHF